MTSTTSDLLPGSLAQPTLLPFLNTRLFKVSALIAIVGLAALLRFANLQALGYANHYYTAAVEAMLKSWHNFFFVAAEPGGAVSVDKPPLGLWMQAISAYFLGVNGFAVLLPEILAGLLSIVVLYHLIQRAFGSLAGLLAALALAITPIVVATDRNNTIDSQLILMLLLAAWAFIKATETGKLKFLFLGAVLVGLGFNIKMLQAYLPLPAFYALYFLGASLPLWRKLINLSLATVILLVVSLSWATIVDLTPASQRPYVGSSGDNSVLSLALGYNGVERLTGMGGGRPGAGGPFGNGGQFGGNGRVQNPIVSFFSLPVTRAGQPFGGGGRGGFPGGSQASIFRLFVAPLNREMSWLLPFGLFSLILVAVVARWRWPLGAEHQALVLWGGWLITGALFFSVAGFFHEYYLSMLAPPLAALVAIGLMMVWRVFQKHTWLGISLLLVPTALTLWFQFATATSIDTAAWWFPFVIILFGVSAGLLIISAANSPKLLSAAGFACAITALFITPGIWSGLTTLTANQNQSLPAAYAGRDPGPNQRGGLQVNQALIDFLTLNTQSNSYLMAVPSSMQGTDYVLQTGRPILYLGGFMGQDKVETGDALSRLVASGQLRYIYWDTRGRGGFGFGQSGGLQSDITQWINSHCSSVKGFDTTTRNSGAPDGTGADTSSNTQPIPGAFGGDLQVSLYDCARG